LRLESLSYRLVPTTDPKAWDLEHLRRQLLEVVRYTDVADSTVVMEPSSRALSNNYLAALLVLANAQFERGNAAECLATLRFADAHVPLARLGLDASMLGDLRAKAEAQLRTRPSQ
jgi:hypothetical protein